MVLKFYASVAKGLKLKIRNLGGLFLLFNLPMRPSEAGVANGRQPLQSSLLMCPFSDEPFKCALFERSNQKYT